MSQSQSQTIVCPTYGKLPVANLKGLPPIPLCCNPLSQYPQCQTPTFQVQGIGKRSICQILPPAPYSESFALVNLPILLFLLITAIPRYFFCLLYDVGLAIYNLTQDVDEFIASILDLLLGFFIGFAEGASDGGCIIIQSFASLFSNVHITQFTNNACPFTYTLSVPLQQTLESIGFAIGSIFGLINTFFGFLLDGLAILLCYLANLSITFGVCFSVLGIQLGGTITFSPFSFLGLLNPFNCGCLLGQMGLCPNLSLIIGNCQSNQGPCTVTNSGCSNLGTQVTNCQNCYNNCQQQVQSVTQENEQTCDTCYQNCLQYCKQQYGQTSQTITEQSGETVTISTGVSYTECVQQCQQGFQQCESCANQIAQAGYNSCQQYLNECYQNGGQPPSNCNPNFSGANCNLTAGFPSCGNG